MTRYPLYRRRGGPGSQSGRVRKISPHRDSIPGPSNRSESIYRLRYPGPSSYYYSNEKIKRRSCRYLDLKTVGLSTDTSPKAHQQLRVIAQFSSPSRPCGVKPAAGHETLTFQYQLFYATHARHRLLCYASQ